MTAVYDMPCPGLNRAAVQRCSAHFGRRQVWAERSAHSRQPRRVRPSALRAGPENPCRSLADQKLPFLLWLGSARLASVDGRRDGFASADASPLEHAHGSNARCSQSQRTSRVLYRARASGAPPQSTGPRQVRRAHRRGRAGGADGLLRKTQRDRRLRSTPPTTVARARVSTEGAALGPMGRTCYS